MSWLTSFLRGVGLGPVLDAVESAEAHPSAETIGGIVAAITAIAPKAADVAIADVGTMAGGVVTGAIAKLNPQAGSVAAAIVGPMLAEVEQVAEKWLGAGAGAG